MMTELVCRSCGMAGGIEIEGHRSPGPVWELFSAPAVPAASCRLCGVGGETVEEIAEIVEIDDAVLMGDRG